MRAASQLRIFATLLVLAACAAVLRGLYFLPALGITLLLIGLLLVGLRARHVGSRCSISTCGSTIAVLGGLTGREASGAPAS